MKKAMNQSKLNLILNGIAITALLLVVVLLFVFGEINGRLMDATEDRFNLTYNANRFMNGSAYLTNEVRAYASTGNQVHYDNYWNEINNLKNRDLGVAAMQEIGITSEEQAMIDEMSSLSNNLVPLEEGAMEQVQSGQMAEALDYVYGSDYTTVTEHITGIKEQFLDELDVRTGQEVRALRIQGDIVRGIIFVALILVGLVQVYVMQVTKKRILKPVIAVRDQMGEISRGNLSADFPLEPDTSEIGMLVESIHETKRELKKYISDIDSKLAQMAQGKMDLSIGSDYRGEFQPIQRAMSQILDSLNNALYQINQTAGQVSQESEKMAMDSQTLSNGAVQQASAVQQLSASIQTLSDQVSSTSVDADNAREASMNAAAQLEACNEKMAELTTAMKDISEASQRISGIIKTIEDISFQTNILALNAAIEAARAGSAGKGFAVVADEVQSLANKSSIAAQDITRLIKNSMNLVEHGTELSAESTQTLAVGVAGARKSTELVERIAVSAGEQAESLAQLTMGMEQISGVVQTNASTAEKSATSAQELRSQSEELTESVQRFRLRR
ncbi:MAG: methyl-accepting chemotaxis protein [Hungatella sp.]|jgi:methyl-accepting chemotaxis protein|nr:methyl-accepting chemotaxis protein [Hungatella sp.]